MEQYYDSDDDVCWGPYTKREFLRDVLQPRNKEDIASRHSVSCDPRFSNDVDKRAESLIESETEPHLQSGHVTESNKFIEKISEILNNTQEVLNCSDCSETHESKEIPDEYNMQLSNKKILEDNDIYFSAESYTSDATKSARHEDTSFITCSFISKINDKNSDSILNVNSGSANLCLNSLATSDAEASTSTSANSSYKKDEDSRDYKSNEIQVITDSEESDVSFKFNDTLEEIDRLLNAEVDFIVSSNISSDAEQETKSYNKLNTPTISLIPIPSKSKTNYDTPIRSVPSQSPYRTEFKIPERPVRPKIVSPMHSKDRFKNIKSPVAVYIKNAPVTPLHVKVTPKKCRKELICENTMSPSKKQNKENVIEFPEVIYQQAKRTVTNMQNTLKLPSNIESLLPSQNLVTKHVAKFGGKKNSISRRLLEEDLTIDTISDVSSLNSSSQNMSIYESKHTFI